MAWALGAVACDGCGEEEEERYGEIVAEGAGPSNAAPLWPLSAGTLVVALDGPGSATQPVSPPNQQVVSQLQTSQGRLMVVRTKASRKGQGAWGNVVETGSIQDTLQLLETKRGDLVVVEPDGRRYLIVPATVRVGMKWRTSIPVLRGRYQFAQEVEVERRYGGDDWTFEVVSREVRGEANDQIVWTIQGTGPRVPHAVSDGKACYGSAPPRLDAVYCTVLSPVENVPRQSLTWQLVEGRGPLLMSSVGGPGGSANVEELAPPGEALAGRSVPELPRIKLHPMALPEEVAKSAKIGLFNVRSARFTASSVEQAAGHAAELVLLGESVGDASLWDPNGQRLDQSTVVRASLCLAFDMTARTLAPLERLAGTCPDRRGPNPNSPGDLEWGAAQPYVTPDGRWWVRGDVRRMRRDGGDRVTGSFMREGLYTDAPFVHRGVLYTLNCYGDAPSAPCALVGFNEQPSKLMRTVNSAGVVPGVYVWGQLAARDLLGSGEPSAVPDAELRFTIPHDSGLIHVTAARPSAVIRWFSWDGRLLDYREVPVWKPSLKHYDGQYVLYDVRPLGELYAFDLRADGLRVRALGRLGVASKEEAEAVIPLDDGRLWVITSRPQGDGSSVGMRLSAPYDSNLSAYGVSVAIPDSALKTLHFYLTDPVDAAARPADPLMAALALPLWQTGSVLTLCDEPGAGVPLVVRALSVGGVAVALGERDARGCYHVVLPAAALAAAHASGVLAVAYEVEPVAGLDGRTIRRHILFNRPAQAEERPAGEPEPIDTLPAPSDRYPVSVRAPDTNVYCGENVNSCYFARWNEPSYWDPVGKIKTCDATKEKCVDILAYDGPKEVLDTHEYWAADPNNVWAPHRPELFPPGRIYWIPRERPPGPLVAADFEGARPLDGLKRHYVITPDAQAWRLPRNLSGVPEDPADPPGVMGTWPAALGLPLATEESLDVSSLLAGSGLEALPTPRQRWRGVGQTLEIYGPPLSIWLRGRVEATPRGYATRWERGALPWPDARALATDGELIVWGEGAAQRLEGRAAGLEVCNGLDDDADGAIDVASAPLCVRPNAITACHEGVCFQSGCAAGWAACDAADPVRCDVALGTLKDCLGCGDTCADYGGAVCEATGCTHARLAQVFVSGQVCWRRFENGDLLRDGEREGQAVSAAGSVSHSCRIDASGELECACPSGRLPDGPCLKGSGRSAEGATPVFAGVGPFDAVWAGEGSSCARARGTGALYCWGRIVTTDTSYNGEVRMEEVAELRGATSVVFGGPSQFNAYALVGGEVYVFGPVFTGATPTWRVERVEGLPPVTAVVAAAGYALFRTEAGVYGLGALGGFEALGGPSARVWATPARAPGLDEGLELAALDGAPCVRLTDRVRCAYEPGRHGVAPGWTKRVDIPWIEREVAVQAIAASGQQLCIVADDRYATAQLSIPLR
jgi:hypothetical protein